MFNIKGRITSKLLELYFIWIYGSKIKAKLDLNKFLNNPLYTSQDEAIRAFENADFWEYLSGFEEGQPFKLSIFFTRVEEIDNELLFKKITNPYQIELLRKKQFEKSSIRYKVFQPLFSKKSINKQTICDEFSISNETFVKWIDFIEKHQWIQRCNEDIPEEYKSLLSNLKDVNNSYKLSLLDYMLLYKSLNKDNPISKLSFNKEDLSHLINGGPSNLYKNLSYVIHKEELNFNIFPFTFFKELAIKNGYGNNDEVLKNDMEEIFAKKSINSAVSDSIITAS
ncbi:MAG: hypothetical protein H7098_13485 [Oligoflexus sp.]|nr:hypothetical protein [Pseudopedobacter sp.]